MAQAMVRNELGPVSLLASLILCTCCSVFTHYIIKASQNIHDFTKVLSQTIYFGTEFEKLEKFLPQKLEAIQ